MPVVSTQRVCHVEPNSWLMPGASLTWHVNEPAEKMCTMLPCAFHNGIFLTYSTAMRNLRSSSNAFQIDVSHAVTHLTVSGNDIWLAGGRCMTSAGSRKKICVKDPNFRIVDVASLLDAVYVMGKGGDVYVSHHVEPTTRLIEVLLNLTAQDRGKARLLTPFVPATVFFDDACMQEKLGVALSLRLFHFGLVRKFAYATVTTPVNVPTAHSVWLPYVQSPHTLCEPETHACSWHEYRSNNKCVPRKPCNELKLRPTHETDYVCGKQEQVARIRTKRQSVCKQTVYSVPARLTCDDTAAENECVANVEAEARRRTAAAQGISEALAFITAPAPTCDNTSFLLGTACIPCSECGMGSYLLHTCTPTRDTMCVACPPDTYMADSWHTNRYCLLTNGCPGSTRFNNGKCRREGYNYNTLWALALPGYAFLISRYQNIMRREVRPS